MSDYCKSKKCSPWISVGLIIYFIINLRVAAGIGTVFERALDGLVGGVVLFTLLYIGARFFKIINPAGENDPLACYKDDTE